MSDWAWSTDAQNRARAKRRDERFAAKLARLSAKGVRVIPGSSLWNRLWESAR